MVKAQIVKEKGQFRGNLLERVNTRTSKTKLLISLTIQPFRMTKAYCKNFNFCKHPIKIIKGFFLRLSLKDYLLIAALPKINNIAGYEPFGKGTYQVCNYIIRTNTLTTKARELIFKIQSGPLKCNSDKVLTFWGVKFKMILPIWKDWNKFFYSVY